MAPGIPQISTFPFFPNRWIAQRFSALKVSEKVAEASYLFQSSQSFYLFFVPIVHDLVIIRSEILAPIINMDHEMFTFLGYIIEPSSILALFIEIGTRSILE